MTISPSLSQSLISIQTPTKPIYVWQYLDCEILIDIVPVALYF